MEENFNEETSQEVERSAEPTPQDCLISALEKFGLNDDQVSNISTIGFRENSAYLVEADGSKYVAKLLADENGRRREDIIRDGYASYLVEQMGVDSRRLLSISEGQGQEVAIFSYVEGRAGFLAKNELLEDESLNKLISLLHKVHEGTLTQYYSEDIEELPWSDSRTDIQTYTLGYLLKDLQATGLPEAENAVGVATSAARNVEKGNFALTHGDVNAHNIVWKESGNPVMIDWSYSQYADPSKDLAGALFYLHETDESAYQRKLLSLGTYSQDFPQVQHNIPFFLGARYITSGSSQLQRGIQDGKSYIQRGLKLLEDFGQG